MADKVMAAGKLPAASWLGGRSCLALIHAIKGISEVVQDRRGNVAGQVQVLPLVVHLCVYINGKFVYVYSGTDESAWCRLFPVLDQARENVPEFLWVGGGAADLAQFPHRDFCLDPRFLVLEVQPDRHGAEFVIPFVRSIAAIEEVLGSGTQELQLRTAQHVIDGFLSVDDVVVVVPGLGFLRKGHGDLPGQGFLVDGGYLSQFQVKNHKLFLSLTDGVPELFLARSSAERGGEAC